MSKSFNSVKILKTAEELQRIKELVKCSICLDIVRNAVRIGCSHIFCNECFKQYEHDSLKGRDISCPVCRTPVNRRLKQDNNAANDVAGYVQSVAGILNDISNTNVLETSLEQLRQNLNLNTTPNLRKRKNSVLTTKRINTPSSKSTPKKNKLNNKSVNKNLHYENDKNKENKCTPKKPLRKKINETNKINKKLSVKNENGLNNKDAFDLLMESSNLNPYSTFKSKVIRTYAAKPKSERQQVFADKVLEFHDNTNKTRILQWLNDTRNKFDNLTFTQQEDVASETDSSISLDMPSVSQVNRTSKTKTRAATQLLKTTQNFHSKRGHKQRQKKRTASLDRCVIKKVYPKQRLKRHSIACETQNIDNMVIEIVDSESESCGKEKAMNSNQQWKLLEEECLRSIELESNSLSHKENITPKNDKKKSNKTLNTDSNSCSTTSKQSDWKRLKSLTKGSRKIKELNIIQGNSNTISDTNKDKTLRSLPKRKLNLNDSNNPTKKHKQSKLNENEQNTNFKKSPVVCKEIIEIENNQDQKSVSYDLNIIESYFAGKISKFIENKKLDDSFNSQKDKTLTSNNLSFSPKNLNENPSVNNDNNSKNNILKTPQKSTLIEKIDYNKKELKKNTEVRNDYVIIEKIVNPIKELDKEGQDDFKGFPNLVESPKKQFKTKETLQVNDCDNNDDTFFQSTQFFLENFDDLNKKDLNKNLNILLKKFLTDVEFQKANRSGEVKFQLFEPTLQAIQYLVKNLESQQQHKDLIDVQTQTETALRDSHVQTNLDTDNVCTQTDTINGFYISSNETFKTQVKVTTETQTDEMKCLKCNKSELQLPSSGVKRTLDSYQFTQSLDNVNFETQDILNQNVIKASQTLNKFSRENVKTHTECNSEKPKKVLETNLHLNQQQSKDKNSGGDKSQLAISAQTQKDSPSGRRKAMIDRLNLENREVDQKFKRIRKPQNDSDSDSEICVQPKKIRNKYVHEDLSVEFDSQIDNPSTSEERKALLSSNIDQIDYEEFMEKVMKKFDHSSSSAISQPESPGVIEKCEVLIKEATRLRPHPFMASSTQKTNKLSLNTLQEFDREFSVSNSNHLDTIDVTKKDRGKENTNSASLFANSEEDLINNMTTKSSKPKGSIINREELDCIVQGISNEFEKSFDAEIDAELEFLHKIKNDEQKGHVPLEPNVIILQNIKLNENSKRKEPKRDDGNEIIDLNKNIDDSFEDVEVNSQKSDDMFDDVDIVESTPQKNRENRKKSEEERIRLPEPQEPLTFDDDVLNCLNMTFTPPPEFQDSEDKDETLKYYKNNNQQKKGDSEGNNGGTYKISSLTPDLLLGSNGLLLNKKLPQTSTPITLDSQLESPIPISLSPINFSHSQVKTPIEVAKSSTFSPLVTVKTKTQAKVYPILASTPKQKSILNYVKPEADVETETKQESIKQAPVTEIRTKPCVSCTRLTKDEVIAINSLAMKKLLTYASVYSECVTHMIVATNSQGCVKDHTMKYVFAVASGIWVLSFKWIQECLKRNSLVPEEPFEVRDVSGLTGPRESRLAVKRDLLKGFKIYIAKPFVSTTPKEVENVVTMLGAKLAPRPDDLLNRNGYVPLIITEARASQDFELYESWLETLRAVTVDLEWLSRSVGQYQLQNLRPFTLCSEDSICELGYPPGITVEVSTQSCSTIS